MRKRDLSKYYPPGYDYQKWNSFAVVALVILFIALLLVYTNRYNSAWMGLNWNYNKTAIVDGSVKMPPFRELLSGSFTAFWIFAAYCVLWGVMMRAYFSQYSNSIYIMRRLQSRKELIRRCTAAPAALLAAGFVICLLLSLLLRLHYRASVPDMCIPAGDSFGLLDLLKAFVNQR